MVMKKEDTPRRISRRRYEEKRKAERQANSGNFQTMIPRKVYERNLFVPERTQNHEGGFDLCGIWPL